MLGKRDGKVTRDESLANAHMIAGHRPTGLGRPRGARARPVVAETIRLAASVGLVGGSVRRISLATSLYRIAMTGLVEAAREVKDKGTFGYIDRSIPTPDLAAFMQG